MPKTNWLFIILFSLIIFIVNKGYGQNNNVVINQILIAGIKRTKPHIILRELPFKQGDQVNIANMPNLLKEAKDNLDNITLFNEIDFNIDTLGIDVINVKIEVEERWYFWPVPVFELADRNLNVWWKEQNRDFKRVNLGGKIYFSNFRGLNDELRLNLQFGYAPKQEVRYILPYLSKKSKLGLIFNASRVTANQIAYNTQNNKLRFIRDDKSLRNKIYTGIALTKRKSYRTYQSIELTYHNTKVNDTIAQLNPNYFKEGKTKQQYFSLYYNYQIDKTDISDYPTTGYQLKFEAIKHGLGLYDDVNFWTVNTTLNKFGKLGKRHLFESQIKTQFVFNKSQPYFNQSALGYEQKFVRGYELYVIDGQDYLLAKLGYKYHLTSFKVKPKIWSQFDNIPFDIYLKAYSDFAQVKDYVGLENDLAQDLLFGYGVGVDIRSYYSLLARFEYSINALGENGLFLHLTLPINNENSFVW